MEARKLPARSSVRFATAWTEDRPAAVLSLLALALAAGTLVSWALVAAVHVDDTYLVHQVSGVWLALAESLQQGTFYPPLYDGEAFGGTRYMPVQIVLFAAGAIVAGDPVLGAKLVVYAIGVLLLAMLYLAVRQVGCPLAVALGLASVALVSAVGILAFSAVGGDTLPVALQLGALILIARPPSRAATAAAAALCALALLAKFSALWGPAAILVWLLARRERRRAAAFAGSFGLALAAGLSATELLSRGRFSDNLLAVSAGGHQGVVAVLLDSPGKLVSLAAAHAIPLLVLVPVVLASVGIALGERRASLHQLALGFAVAILLVVLADPGSFYNHLLDVSVLAIVVAGEVWRRAAPLPELRVLILATVVWALGLGWYTSLKEETVEAARLAAGRADDRPYARRPPPGTIGTGDRVLSDDPYVPLSVGQRPVVVDAFGLIRLLEDNPGWEAELVRRIEEREFDRIALMRPLDDAGWWSLHLGPRVVAAIDRAYRLETHLEQWRDLWIYVPV